MTENELKEQIQYWWNNYCDCTSREEQELYLKAYTTLDEILRIWARENRFEKEQENVLQKERETPVTTASKTQPKEC